MQTIDEYIKSQPEFVERDGACRPYIQADLARDMGIHSNQLTKMKAKGYRVSGGRIWRPGPLITKGGII